MSLYGMLKRHAPCNIIVIARERIRWRDRRRYYSSLSTREAFSDIYRTKAWGEADGEAFCSGFGSDETFAKPYASWVVQFIRERGIRKVVDLGCGDFRVGRHICGAGDVEYVGVDVVPELIDYNQSQFGREGLEFRCADIVRDDLPDGELCMIRQVLQHLSNAQVAQILEKCVKYRYLLVTEDVYAGPRMRPNVDKPHGADNRFYDRSGVYVDLPPFNRVGKTVMEMPTDSRSVLRTLLIEQ